MSEVRRLKIPEGMEQKPLAPLSPVDIDLPERRLPLIRMTVMQEDDGRVKVIEHDVIRGTNRIVAVMNAETRIMPTDDGEMRVDCAQVRGIVFAQLFEELVNTGKVVLG